MQRSDPQGEMQLLRRENEAIKKQTSGEKYVRILGILAFGDFYKTCFNYYALKEI